MFFLVIIFFVIFLQNQDVVASWNREARSGFAEHRDRLEKRRRLVMAVLKENPKTQVVLPPVHSINDFLKRTLPSVDKDLRVEIASLFSRDSFNYVEAEHVLGSCFCGDFEMYYDNNPHKRVCSAVAIELIEQYGTLPNPYPQKYQYR